MRWVKYSRRTFRILRMDNLLFASVRPSCKSREDLTAGGGRPAPLSSDGGVIGFDRHQCSVWTGIRTAALRVELAADGV